MLELSFLRVGAFVVPFLPTGSGLLVSDLVLAVRLRAGLTSAGAGVFAGALAAAGGAAGAAGAAGFVTAGGGGRAPSRR